MQIQYNAYIYPVDLGVVTRVYSNDLFGFDTRVKHKR